MKQWKCPNCLREKTTEDNMVLIYCACGNYYERVDKKEVDKGGKD